MAEVSENYDMLGKRPLCSYSATVSDLCVLSLKNDIFVITKYIYLYIRATLETLIKLMKL